MTVATEIPIGRLIVEAVGKSRKKSSRTHTSKSECGCEVTVSWFSEGGHTVAIRRCFEHPVRKEGSAS